MTSTFLSIDPDVMGGAPVFAGTRVPIKTLTEHFEAGDSIADFLEGFPSVTRGQVIDFLCQQANALVPNEVVNLAFDNGWSAARAWREHLHLTQAVVAKRMQVTQAAVAQFEATGAKLRNASRDKLAVALGLTGEQLAW